MPHFLKSYKNNGNMMRQNFWKLLSLVSEQLGIREYINLKQMMSLMLLLILVDFSTYPAA